MTRHPTPNPLKSETNSVVCRTDWQLAYRSRQFRNPGYERLEQPRRVAERMLKLMDPRCSWKRRLWALRRAEQLLPTVEAMVRKRAS